MRAAQSLLFPQLNFKTAFGGALLKKSHAKTARVVSCKQAMHVVLRSTHARGPRSFLAHAQAVEKILQKQATLCGIRLYARANVGNHLHLIVKTPTRRAFFNYLRSISGLLARLVLKAEKGSPASLRQFWDQRPFSRVLSWGRDYQSTQRYLSFNRLEALGFDRSFLEGPRVASSVMARKGPS